MMKYNNIKFKKKTKEQLILRMSNRKLCMYIMKNNFKLKNKYTKLYAAGSKKNQRKL